MFKIHFLSLPVSSIIKANKEKCLVKILTVDCMLLLLILILAMFNSISKSESSLVPINCLVVSVYVNYNRSRCMY